MTERQNFERRKPVTRVLLADKNMLFRRGLRTILGRETDLELLEDAAATSEVLSRIHSENPDVLMISLDLMGDNARHFGYFLRRANANLSILVLTPSDSPENLQLSIEAGAKGYMVKNSSPAQFVKAVRQVSLSNGQDPTDLSSTVPDLRALAARTPPTARPNLLTSREQEVVRLLAEGKTVKEVAHDLALSIKTVEAHKLNLMRKLNIHNRSSLIEYATREGMVGVS